MKKLLISCAVACLLSTPALAAQKPIEGKPDSRVKHVIYHPQDVVNVRGHYGYSTSIEFSNEETINTVSMGDSMAWQVTPANDHLLFIKPLQPNADTNMTVVTNKRIYSFELNAAEAHSSKSGQLTYRLRFVYPEDESEMSRYSKSRLSRFNPSSDSTIPSDWNFHYSYSGTKANRPVRTFDNGKFTYFQFSEHNRTPAIFAVDDSGNELLLNHHQEGKYIVVKRLSPQFTLRDGDNVTCIFNESFPQEEFKETAFVPMPVEKPKYKTFTEHSITDELDPRKRMQRIRNLRSNG